MGKPTGFMEYERRTAAHNDPAERIEDFGEFKRELDDEARETQGARCMDCGVPFCQSDFGCPVDNLIPEWNDLIYHGKWDEAFFRLMKTNNFPEYTGRVCPAPCEHACVLAI
ncbi:MAG TPA: glutamate synthase, partial [Alkalispirochaeta sp.]|nr:glutamate synthase [Alkalispirochaeta sp.]